MNRMFETIRNILKQTGRKEMYVFLEGTSLCDPEWLAVGPHEDPHTYPTLEERAEYQDISDAEVYLLFPVPADIVRRIMEEHKERE